MHNKFVVFEGIDGSGTTVQTQLLYERIQKEGVPVHKTAEPSTGCIGKLIRQIIGGKTYTYLNKMDPERLKVILTLLFTADRADHVWTEVEVKLKEGLVVLCDRYAISTLAYELGVLTDRGWIEEVGKMLPLPTLTFYLRLPAEVAFERLKRRWEEKGEGGSDPEIFEKLEVQRKLVSHYDAFCGHLHAAERVAYNHSVRTIDATGEIEEVHERVWGMMKPHLIAWEMMA